jgi:hypothetical protein
MDFRAILTDQYSKASITRIVAYVSAHPEHTPDLLAIFLGDDPLLVQRSAWAIGDLGRSRPDLLVPYHAALLAACRRAVHPAVVRNVIRYFSEAPELPEAIHGELADRCFRQLADPKAPVAIRVFSMTVLQRLTETYPELAHELRVLIEEEMPRASAGFRSRGNKVLRALRRLEE